jgi:hypothetical protein
MKIVIRGMKFITANQKRKPMSKEKGRKWDGKSRISNDVYRKRFDEIFNKKKPKVNKDEKKDIQKVE